MAICEPHEVCEIGVVEGGGLHARSYCQHTVCRCKVLELNGSADVNFDATMTSVIQARNAECSSQAGDVATCTQLELCPITINMLHPFTLHCNMDTGEGHGDSSDDGIEEFEFDTIEEKMKAQL